MNYSYRGLERRVTIPLPRYVRPGCEQGSHVAFTTTDRDAVWCWVCRYCPAVRDQGDPTWRTP